MLVARSLGISGTVSYDLGFREKYCGWLTTWRVDAFRGPWVNPLCVARYPPEGLYVKSAERVGDGQIRPRTELGRVGNGWMRPVAELWVRTTFAFKSIVNRTCINARLNGLA